MQGSDVDGENVSGPVTTSRLSPRSQRSSSTASKPQGFDFMMNGDDGDSPSVTSPEKEQEVEGADAHRNPSPTHSSQEPSPRKSIPSRQGSTGECMHIAAGFSHLLACETPFRFSASVSPFFFACIPQIPFPISAVPLPSLVLRNLGRSSHCMKNCHRFESLCVWK